MLAQGHCLLQRQWFINKGCSSAMSSRRNIPIYDRWKSLSSDLMLPVTSVSINWTWISEHYLQPSRNPSIPVPPQTNIWTLLNSRAERILFGISVLFELLQKCLKTLKRCYTISWHFHHTVSDAAVRLMVPDATWYKQLMSGGLIPYFSSKFCWMVEQESSHILTR